MKNYKAYLIDLDGTMYRGEESIEEAIHFVKALESKGIPYLFVTNNSARTPEQVADKLVNFGIPATAGHVFTTSMATAIYLDKWKKGASVHVIGEEGLHHALTEKGFTFTEENPDAVIMGIDREINYEKLAIACIAVRNGAKFISTNGDIAIPTERGLLPGNGSLTAIVSVSTTVKPTFIGKPEVIMMEQAIEILGVSMDEAIMVGDNYDTDILAGINAGMDTLLVHTGVTQKEHLGNYDVQPTYTVHSLDEWTERM